jgi:peptide/nickel transport system substrate-binding protein
MTMVLSSEPTALVGLLTSAIDTYFISGKVNEGLVTYDWNFDPQPALAESWEVRPDGKGVTFHLRKGVKWHDGTDFTARDVKFSIEVLKARHPRGRITFANVEQVLVPDDYTVVLNLSAPAPYLMTALAGPESPMVPEHVYAGTDFATNPNNTAPIGTGPFKFREWKKGSYVILERNENYWQQGKPYLDRIVIRFISDAAARAVAIESGEVQLAPGSPVSFYDVERLSRLPNIGVERRGDEYGSLVARIEFNLDNKYLKNLDVRRAIAHAIDKEFIRKNIWFGYSDATASQISPNLKRFYTEDVPKYDYSPTEAERLLDQAGFPRAANGVRFTLVHDYLPVADTFRRTAEYIKQALRKVGIEVTIRGEDFPSYVRRVYTERAFDFSNNWMNDTPDPTLGVQRLYWSKNFARGVPFSNGSNYSNAEMDAALEAAQVENNSEVRAKLWQKIAFLEMRDLPDLPLVAVGRLTLYNKKIRAHTESPLGAADPLSDTWIGN